MKNNELIKAIRKIGADFNELAGLLDREDLNKEEEPVEVKAPTPETPAAPAPAPVKNEEIKFETVRGALASKAGAGYRAEVKAILKEHDLSCLSDIEKHPDLFAGILKEAEAIGNG